MKKITYNKQYLDNKDIKEVIKSLKNDLITTGPFVKRFENKLSKYLGVKNVITCSSGTSALYIALRALDIKKNDVIIIPAINFIASINMAQILGAKIYLCDVNENTGQMTPETLLECIKINKLKKIKAVITMYLGGNPNNIVNFYKLKKKYNFYLVEDSCHALGSSYYFKKKKIKIGSCYHSDISTFSLHPVKSITSGEGGFLTTNSKFLSDKFKLLRSHGIIRSNRKKKYWKYDVSLPSFNFRMSDINASIGIHQLKKIDSFLSIRRKYVAMYDHGFADIPEIETLACHDKVDHAHHLYIIALQLEQLKVDRDGFLDAMQESGIGVAVHYIGLHLQPFYVKNFHI